MSDEPSSKRPKLTLPFKDGLLTSSSIETIKNEISSSKPYKHAVIKDLFDDDFLNKAKKELCENVSFSEKETDIYRISQTGDLTNLSGLPSSEQALLSTLLQLRDALYSTEFRSFLQAVTGCGALSGIKTDMSCAEYGQGSYLLNHDDVIGTRRISFILYLVGEEPKWDPEWGGSLELYPVVPSEGDRPNVPEPKPSVIIPPAFNQFTFFQVQPGHSFHSVEEVVVEGDGKRGGVGSRLSLSGWFHKPVEGEEGYEGEEKEGEEAKSSLQQLYKSTLKTPTLYPSPITSTEISSSATAFSTLSSILNPSYLQPSTLSQLNASFTTNSHVLLSQFLHPDLSTKLSSLILEADQKLNKNRRRAIVSGEIVDKMPSHTEGEGNGWQLCGPPHLQRFLALSTLTKSSLVPAQTQTNGEEVKDELIDLLSLIKKAFESSEFAQLLSMITGLDLLGYTIDVRRFRPGLDYTLARGEEVKHQLDVGLGLTPESKFDKDRELWEEGSVGGWEVWLDNSQDDGGDEATYGGGKKRIVETKQSDDQEENGEAQEDEDEEEEEDDGPLLSLEPSWNQLSIVLRDPKVMKFVKYVSAKAPGSRWDVGGEWEVNITEEDEDQDEE